jgi:DNA modification methylase
MSYRVLIGDNRETLREIPDGTVQCVVTSPPYYGLRDYGHDGQIGLEETPEQFVQALVDVFREVRRVLRDDGTLWLNLGDSYAGAGYSNHANTGGAQVEQGGKQRHLTGTGLKNKDLIGIPWRVAFALQADGWYLRQDIIWHKPNPMPESVTDRCTKAHEYVFLLSKSARYFYDAEAVKEAVAESSIARLLQDVEQQTGTTRANGGAKTNGNLKAVGDISGRNRRSVWTVATQPYSGAHFATFPPKLIEPCILAGSAAQACEVCGAPWERVVETEKPEARFVERKDAIEDRPGSPMYRSGTHNSGLADNAFLIKKTTGYRPTCTCDNNGTGKSVVLDPFGGSGTTAAVALEHGREAILCELSLEYAELIPDRINSITDAARQSRLFEGSVT